MLTLPWRPRRLQREAWPLNLRNSCSREATLVANRGRGSDCAPLAGNLLPSGKPELTASEGHLGGGQLVLLSPHSHHGASHQARHINQLQFRLSPVSPRTQQLLRLLQEATDPAKSGGPWNAICIQENKSHVH